VICIFRKIKKTVVMDLLAQIEETKKYIIKNTNGFTPAVGIILGTGLGGLVKDIEIAYSLDYAQIPHFPVSTVESHTGRLIFGEINGVKVVAMSGRFHYYEGYTMQQVTFPVRVMKALGIERLMISNASGGLKPEEQEVGDLMILNDHINLLPEHPLRGKNEASLGPRFPDMIFTYDQAMIAQGKAIAEAAGIRCHTGVYAAVQGPCLETPAEYRWLKIIGADVVGMSTVPEAIVAHHMSLPVFAISVITDLGNVADPHEVSIEDVIKAANIAEPKMTRIIKELIMDNG
jgi:purine-nucleoside phosphorylase